jgi:hypothetical protein
VNKRKGDEEKKQKTERHFYFISASDATVVKNENASPTIKGNGI